MAVNLQPQNRKNYNLFGFCNIFLLSSVGLEHLTVNQGVLGSSPRGGAQESGLHKANRFFLRFTF